VPLHLHFIKGDESHHYVFSTFVISIEDGWFLITAGHCLKEIEDILKAGYFIEKGELLDFVNINSTYSHSVPFNFEASFSGHMGDNKYDYGIIYLEDHYKRLLEANGVKALDEEVWEKQPDDPDFYLLLGVPGQLTEVTEDKITITTALYSVTKCEKTPEEFEKTDAPTFYGKIHLDDNSLSIKGMSGGPLFSFKSTDSGELKYWLCAVQSRWIQPKKLIAACLTTPFISFVKSTINDFRE
jgi:hypothetical protein